MKHTFILYSKYGHPYVFPLPLLFSNLNHSTLLEIHSSEVRHSTEAGITFLVERLVTGWRSEVRAQMGRDIPYPSGQTIRYRFSFSSVGGPDANIITFVFSCGSGLNRDESILWSRSLGLESISLEPMAPFVKIYQNCLVVWWLTLNIRREKGDIWTHRK